MKLKTTIALGLSLAVALPAFAQNETKSCDWQSAYQEPDCWYFSWGMGRSDLKPVTDATWMVKDDSDMALKVGLGLALDEHFFTELSWNPLGDANLANINSAIADEEITYMATSLTLGYWLLPQQSEWNAFVRAGAALMNKDSELEMNDELALQHVLGVGAQWRFAPKWMLRAEWDRYEENDRYLGLSISRFFGPQGRQRSQPESIAKRVEKPALVQPVVPPEPVVKPVAPTPTPAPVVEEQPVVLEKITLNIQFDTASTALKSQYMAQLKAVAEKIKRYADVQISVEGHSDSIGAEKPNQILSERRASAVMDALIQESGLSAALFSAKGHGELKPVADNRTAEGRYQNRRVEVLIQQP